MPDGESILAVRRAGPAQAAELSALAMRSKAYWGYSEEFLAVVRPMLTFTAEDLERDLVYVLDAPRGVVGMYRLTGGPPRATLEDLWLDPSVIGSGAGRRLFEHARQTAAAIGIESLLIESDPNAEGFYLAMGAVRIGEQASPSGRVLPLLEIITLPPPEDPSGDDAGAQLPPP